MKRKLALVMTLVMTLSLLTGFVKTKSKAKDGVTLSYFASVDWIPDAEKKLAEKFEKETGIHIDFQIAPSDQYLNLLKVKLNANEAPDIFGAQSGKFDIEQQYKVVEDTVDLSNEPWAKQINPLVKEQSTVNGKLYGLEIADNSNVWCITYNKAIFEKLKLKVPTNYIEFKIVCAKIKAAGITPIYEAVADGWHHVLWFPEIGPQFENLSPGLGDKLNNNKMKFADSKSMLTALTQLKELVQLGYFGKNYMSNTYADTERNMTSGKYAMTLNNLGEGARIELAYPKVKASEFGYFVNPLADNQIISINPAGPTAFISSQSAHIKEAKMFFAYLTTHENLQYSLDNNPNVNNLDFPGLKDKFTAEQKTFFNRYKKQGTVYQTNIKYVNPQWMDIGKDLAAMFLSAKKPLDVLKSIDTRRAQAAAAAKDPSWK